MHALVLTLGSYDAVHVHMSVRPPRCDRFHLETGWKWVINATYGTRRGEPYDDGDDGSCDPRQPDGSGVLHPEAVNDGRKPGMLAAMEAAQQRAKEILAAHAPSGQAAAR